MQEKQNSTKWWEGGIIYQIYPLSFADSNGDGVGDLRGIIEKLDYLNDGNPESETSLGVDAIWLSPVNKSPMVDNGYDVSDYRDIAPVFGTLEDFTTLIKEAHRRGLKLIMDLVINHTSSEHSWFQESCQSKDNPKSDWYLWQDSYPGGGVPNNWLSYFGGSGWTFHEQRQQYYYHTFNENQPDINWRNPEVRKAIYDIIRFWLDLGVDGFRLDASSVYSQDKFFRDNPIKFGATDKNSYNNQHHLYNKNLPENHYIIKEIRQIVDEYEERAIIGETFIDNRLYDSVLFYGVDQDELHLPFDFEFPFSPWHPGYLQREVEKNELLTPKGAWASYFLDNHDIPRHLSRWVECSLCVDTNEIARAAAALLLTVRGTPFIYYGQEIGMVNHLNIPPEKSQDQAVSDSGAEELPSSRDGARTPMQWDDSPQAGFSFGKHVEPWLPVNENYWEVNVEKGLANPKSILNFYRSLIRVRKEHEALLHGSWRTLIHYPDQYMAYIRETEKEKLLILINFFYEQSLVLNRPVEKGKWRILLANHRQEGEVIDLPETLLSFEVSIFKKE